MATVLFPAAAQCMSSIGRLQTYHGAWPCCIRPNTPTLLYHCHSNRPLYPHPQGQWSFGFDFLKTVD